MTRSNFKKSPLEVDLHIKKKIIIPLGIGHQTNNV